MTRNSAAVALCGISVWIQACRTNDVVLIELPAGAAGLGASVGGGGIAGAPTAGAPTAGSGFAGASSAGGPSGGAPGAGSGGVSGGGGGMPLAGTCKSDVDCEEPSRCARASCQAELGTCERAQIQPCPTELLPVCGCNPRVTYWNACIARQNGEFVTDDGECLTDALACATAEDCQVPGAYCAHLHRRDGSGDPCSPRPGSCWVVPPTCSGQDLNHWGECPPPAPGQLPVCVDTCTAIMTELPWVWLPPRVMCQ